jgi:hypothetical protein
MFLISDSNGFPISSSDDAGFSARVRAVTKENLSASALGFAQMKTAIDSGMGEVFLFYYHEDKWQMAGAGTIEEKSNDDGTSYYQAVSGDGVFFEGLYPFVFVYAGKKIITGKVVDGTEPVANALVTITSSRDTAVSGSDGTFSISIPDTLTSVRMKILHQDYYIMEKPVEFTGSETQKDIGNIFLTALIKKNPARDGYNTQPGACCQCPGGDNDSEQADQYYLSGCDSDKNPGERVLFHCRNTCGCPWKRCR